MSRFLLSNIISDHFLKHVNHSITEQSWFDMVNTGQHVYIISDFPTYKYYPYHPLLSPSSLALNPSQHQDLLQWSALCIRWPKYWSFSFRISPSNEYSGLISFRVDWFDIFAVRGTGTTIEKHQLFGTQFFFRVQLSHPSMTTGKTIALIKF